MYILGIESSCDDFALAVLDADNKQIVYSKIISQKHRSGVFPEMAARIHAMCPWQYLEYIISKYQIGAVAVTTTPGLIGSLYIGLTIAKTLAFALNVPLISVNHVDAHILTPMWYTDLTFPYLALVVSGGHTLLALAESFEDIKIIGSTQDDAAGEVFDKTARMLGLEYPGGPHIERLAKLGTPKYKLPIPMRNHTGYNFSFSGLKEAVRQQLDNIDLNDTLRADWSASIQHAITQALIIRTEKAAIDYNVEKIAIVGGVAANNYIRQAILELGKKISAKTFFSPHSVCGDNAEMIAWLGYEKFKLGQCSNLQCIAVPKYEDLPRRRWMQT